MEQSEMDIRNSSNTRIRQDAEQVYNFLAETDPLPERADFILAAGTYDLRVADHAARLFLDGYAPLIVCSGGFGKLTSQLFHQPEAELFAARCRRLGVPEDCILTEPRATNTGENFTYSRELLEARSIMPQTGIVACKPYMARRVWATGTKQWPEVRWFPCGMPLSLEEYLTDEVTWEETVPLMVGDLQRLRVYEEMGYQVHVEVPDDVWQAYERLAAAGYDRYVIR